MLPPGQLTTHEAIETSSKPAEDEASLPLEQPFSSASIDALSPPSTAAALGLGRSAAAAGRIDITNTENIVARIFTPPGQ
ncbi:hypothetical protein BE08_31070 [Sorangium cellulosum]|uniref:Uncharacterized protein n=1 Tax=Sorangium cellulosum TaxID=56 RepID=A0A150PSA6_SORCE|nr:hypothetical protein BE08_31070 [Sorangium cellulosum]